MGRGAAGRGATGIGRGWHWGVGQRRSGQWGGEDGKGGKDKEVGWGGGEEEARGGEISQMDMLGCLGGHGL